MNEIWRNIKGYEGLYQISNLGRVKSLLRKDCLGRVIKERILKSGRNKCGYLYVILCKDGQTKAFKVHRLVAKAFIFNFENKPCVNHKSGIKVDCTEDNLEWCTFSENEKYVYNIGLKVAKGIKGENNVNSKLVKANILQIRESSLSSKELAKTFKVSHRHINKIKNNKRWGHVL